MSPASVAAEALAPRWQGQPGRVEVYYVTLDDPATGLGVWVHHELVAPLDGPPYVHGWAAVFLSDAPPVTERFGPVTLDPGAGIPSAPREWPGAWVTLDPPAVVAGQAGRLEWELHADDPGDAGEVLPLYTFPRWAWDKEALPAAQIVPVPNARIRGVVAVDGAPVTLSPEARGAVAHIYGHGNAKQWGWLHADLGGGDVLEVVTATSRRPGLDRLPPLAFVQLRARGRDWPRDPLVAAPLFRTRLGLPAWSVRGTVGRWRLRAEVTIAPEASVALSYTDPDGATATCTNSERADAEIVLEHRRARWEVAATWTLRGRAHAEVGTRP